MKNGRRNILDPSTWVNQPSECVAGCYCDINEFFFLFHQPAIKAITAASEASVYSIYVQLQALFY